VIDTQSVWKFLSVSRGLGITLHDDNADWKALYFHSTGSHTSGYEEFLSTSEDITFRYANRFLSNIV
jgi:hypothetical protein